MVTHARAGSSRNVAIAIVQVLIGTSAASSTHSQPKFAPRRRSGFSADRSKIVRLPCSLIVPVLMFSCTSIFALRAMSSNILRAPSRSMALVGAIIMPVLPAGWRNTSITPARVLPLPRPPINARNLALLRKNASCGAVDSVCFNKRTGLLVCESVYWLIAYLYNKISSLLVCWRFVFLSILFRLQAL